MNAAQWLPRPYRLRESMVAAYVGRCPPEWVMIVACYLDDSFHARRSAIAGYLGPMDVWDYQFTPAWYWFLNSAPHPITEYKTDDIRQSRGEFEGWSDEEREAYMRQAIGLIGDAARFPHLYGIGTASILPRTTSDEDRAEWDRYGAMHCFVTILVNAVNFVRRWRPRIKALWFVCDRMPSGKSGLFIEAFNEAKQIVADDCDFDIDGLDFRDSRRVLPIQAADLLAYETRKELANRLESPQRARSRGLIHLLEHRPHVGFYVDQTVLEGARDDKALPPVLYQSDVAHDMMPWIDRTALLDPPPLLPDDRP